MWICGHWNPKPLSEVPTSVYRSRGSCEGWETNPVSISFSFHSHPTLNWKFFILKKNLHVPSNSLQQPLKVDNYHLIFQVKIEPRALKWLSLTIWGPGSEDQVYVFPFTREQFHIWGSWNLHRLDLPFTSCVFQPSHVAALGLSVFISRMEIIIRILKSLSGFSEIVNINCLAQCLEHEVTHLRTVITIEGEKIHGIKYKGI